MHSYRICQELDAIASQHEPKDMVVCVSHSDPIKLAVAYFLGMPLDLFSACMSPGFDHCAASG